MKYRPEIDGLRAFAVVPVILYHAGFPAFSGGYVGVDVFFVISGFLITTIIADQISQGQFSLMRFYERRARRILPVLFTVILASLPFAWFWLMPRDLETYTYSVLAVATFTSNLFFFSETGYFETAAELQPMLHTWSLAVEEQYYIVFPLLMMLIWHRAPGVILSALLVISLLAAEWALDVDPAAVFFLLPTRAWELLMGALAALYLRRAVNPSGNALVFDGLSALGLGLVVMTVVFYDDTTRFPGIAAVPPTVGTVLMILFARPGGVVHRALSLRPLVWIGLISYGAYLWHQPVFSLFQHRFGSVAFTTYAVPLIGLSFALAFASFHSIEQPFRKGASVRTLIWAMFGSVTVAVGAAVVMFIQVDKGSDNVPSYQWAVANADANLIRYIERRDVFMPCGDGADDAGIQRCDFGDPAAARSVVLWGDSLALALLSGMDEVARAAGIGGVAFIANGCPPVLGLSNTHVQTCNGDTHDQIVERIAGLSSVTDVVVTGNLHGAIHAGNVKIDGQGGSYALVRDKLSMAMSRLKSAGMRLVLLEQGPTFPEDVSSYLIQNMRHGHFEPLTVDIQQLNAFLKEVRNLADLPDVYVTTQDVFCDAQTCPSVDADGQIVMFDRTHVTQAYATKLAKHVFDRAGL